MSTVKKGPCCLGHFVMFSYLLMLVPFLPPYFTLKGDGATIFENTEKRAAEIATAMHEFYKNLHLRRACCEDATFREVRTL